MKPFELTATAIEGNYNALLTNIDMMFPTRAEALRRMYESYGDTVALAPASSVDYYHNAIPGGYIDHVLRVFGFSFEVYELWRKLGIPVDDFTPEELAFVAIHHDLGKLGLPGNGSERYVPNDSEWHRKNMGKMYDTNGAIPFMTVPDMGLFVLQHFQIPLSLNETFGIRLHDGMYDEVNRPYLLPKQHKSAMRTYLPMIVHQADYMASRFEYERWATSSGNSLTKVNM